MGSEMCIRDRLKDNEFCKNRYEIVIENEQEVGEDEKKLNIEKDNRFKGESLDIRIPSNYYCALI